MLMLVTQVLFSGLLLDPLGMPVGGATIYLTSVNSNGPQLEFQTTTDGRFEFSGIEPGDYRVTAGNSSFEPFIVTLERFDRVQREIRLPFGPFSLKWTVAPPRPPEESRVQPPGYRCADVGQRSAEGRALPMCGPESLVKEFEDEFAFAERERLKRPVLAPRMMSAPTTAFPQVLIEQRIEGAVVMEARLREDGTLRDLRVVSSDRPELAEAAVASASSARWEPARLRGTPTEVQVTLNVFFRLEPR